MYEGLEGAQAPHPAAAAAADLQAPEDGPREQPDLPGLKPVVRANTKFMEVWTEFRTARGLSTKEPHFRGAPLSLLKLFAYIYAAGGAEQVTLAKLWSRLGRAAFNPPRSVTDLAHQMKKIYTTTLAEFEDAYRKGEVGVEVELPELGPECAPREPPLAGAPAPPRAAAAKAKPAAKPAAAAKEQSRVPTTRQRPEQQSQRPAPVPAPAEQPAARSTGPAAAAAPAGAAAGTAGVPRPLKRTRFAAGEGEAAEEEVTTPRKGAAQMLLDAAGFSTPRMDGQDTAAPPPPAGAEWAAAVPPGAVTKPGAAPTPELVAAGTAYQAYRFNGGFEIFALLPGAAIEQLVVRCWSSGQVLLQVNARGGGGPLYSELVTLPGRIDTRDPQALFTLAGQLYVRVNRI